MTMNQYINESINTYIRSVKS